MDTTLQPSLQQSLRSRITTIEAIELAFLAFAFWCFGAAVSVSQLGESLADQMGFLLGTELIVLGSWAIYNLYIRIARAGGRIIDIGLWIAASLLTGTYTFWAWTVLDINRFLITKLFYRGEAPVEYAWSIRSKAVRKIWEQSQRARPA